MSQISDEQQMEAASQQVAAKLRAFHESLTDDERLVLDRAIRRFVAGADADASGYMIAEYEDAYGYKGKIGTGGESAPPVGSGTTLAPLFPVVMGTIFVLSAGGAANSEASYP